MFSPLAYSLKTGCSVLNIKCNCPHNQICILGYLYYYDGVFWWPPLMSLTAAERSRIFYLTWRRSHHARRCCVFPWWPRLVSHKWIVSCSWCISQPVLIDYRTSRSTPFPAVRPATAARPKHITLVLDEFVIRGKFWCSSQGLVQQNYIVSKGYPLRTNLQWYS